MVIKLSLGVGEQILLVGLSVFAAFKLFVFPVALSLSLLPLAVYIYRQNALYNYWKNRGFPSAPANFFLGNTIEYHTDVRKLGHDGFAKFGKTFGIFVSGRPHIATKDPVLIKQVLIKEFESFYDREASTTVKTDIFSQMLPLLSGGDWRRVRQRITPAFTTGKMRRLLPPMEYCSHQLVDYFKTMAGNDVDVDLKDAFGKLTMNVIGRSAFAMDFNTFKQKEDTEFVKFANLLFQNSQLSGMNAFKMFFPNIAEALRRLVNKPVLQNLDMHEFFNNTVNQIIDARLQDPQASTKYHDALQLLLNSVDDEVLSVSSVLPDDIEFVSENVQNAKTTKGSVTRMEVVAQMTIFLLAGYETTATTLNFTVYNLAHQPEIQARARDEVLRVFGDKKSLEYEDIAQLVYLKQVIYESLRLYSPASIVSRICKNPIEINGIKFEEGTAFTAMIWDLHHDGDLYPDPETFNPERFSAEEKANRDPMAFLPFGGGPRSCIGLRFAEFEMLTSLAHLLKNFEFLPSINDITEFPVPVKPHRLTKAVKLLKCQVKSL